MRTVHPFPARMAPDIVFNYLRKAQRGALVLDPMAGSGTTLAAARLRGLRAFGADTDPLAVTIARVNTADIKPSRISEAAERVLRDAQNRAKRLKECNAYPASADEETCQFLDYWFDPKGRIQLTALLRALAQLNPQVRTVMQCAFSRMIIAKERGVSLAEDVSHSRPHKTRFKPPVYPFDFFMPSTRAVLAASSFIGVSDHPAAIIKRGDCRRLPFPSDAFDYVITSPPYLNAIDYLRGHKLSLVWLGHTIAELRELRSESIGSDVGLGGRPKCTTRGRLKVYQGRWPLSELKMYHR